MSYTPDPDQTPILEEMIYKYACPLDRDGIWPSKELPEHPGEHEDMSLVQVVSRLTDLMIKHEEPMHLRLALAEETKGFIKSMLGLHADKTTVVNGLESIDADMHRLTASSTLSLHPRAAVNVERSDDPFFTSTEHHKVPGSNGITVTKHTPQQSQRTPIFRPATAG